MHEQKIVRLLSEAKSEQLKKCYMSVIAGSHFCDCSEFRPGPRVGCARMLELLQDEVKQSDQKVVGEAVQEAAKRLAAENYKKLEEYVIAATPKKPQPAAKAEKPPIKKTVYGKRK